MSTSTIEFIPGRKKGWSPLPPEQREELYWYLLNTSPLRTRLLESSLSLLDTTPTVEQHGRKLKQRLHLPRQLPQPFHGDVSELQHESVLASTLTKISPWTLDCNDQIIQ